MSASHDSISHFAYMTHIHGRFIFFRGFVGKWCLIQASCLLTLLGQTNYINLDKDQLMLDRLGGKATCLIWVRVWQWVASLLDKLVIF